MFMEEIGIVCNEVSEKFLSIRDSGYAHFRLFISKALSEFRDDC